MPDDLPTPAPDAGLYPAGHLERLTYEALLAERGRQRAATGPAAATRARLCTQEIIRRRLAALAPTEPMQ